MYLFIYLFIYLFLFIYLESAEYKIFYKLMGWLAVYLVDLLAWWGPLQRGDLVYLITGQLVTVFAVVVWRYLVEGVAVMGSGWIPVLYGAWYFWRRWRNKYFCIDFNISFSFHM